MGSSLDPKLLSVGELFEDAAAHYEIPIYQRNYAWGVEQIEQLIDDVWAAVEAGADSYFVGNVIVASPVDEARLHTTYQVVDGQQRLTTLFMLLVFLDVEPHAKLTYEARRAATDALSRLRESDAEDSAGIHTGFKVIASRLNRSGSDTDDRRRFRTFLCERVQLVRATLPDGTDLNRYFEIMNTRGQQLEQVDIVKARLMSRLDDDAERECFAWIWNGCADMKSYVQMALTPGDPTRRSEIFGPDWNELVLDTFTDLVPLARRVREANSTSTMAMSLRDAERRYARAAERPAEEDRENRRFESPIRFPSLLLHALKVFRESDPADDGDDGQLDDGRLIKLFEDALEPSVADAAAPTVRRFTEVLLRCRFILDNFVLKREFTAANGQDGAWSLKRLARRNNRTASYPNAFRPGADEWDDAEDDSDPTREILLLQSMLRITYTSPRTMHWITAVLRLAPSALTTPNAAEAVRSTLRDYARGKVRQAIGEGPLPTGFGIERVVFTYLDYLLALDDRDPQFQFVFRNSIEHFYPQSPDEEIRQTYDELQDEGDRDLFGNLALLTVRGNSKFTNNPPFIKAEFRHIVEQSPKLRRMAAVARKHPRAWNSAAIKQHDREMVDLLRADLRPRGSSGSALSGPASQPTSRPGTTSVPTTGLDRADALEELCRDASDYVRRNWRGPASDYRGRDSSTGAPIYGIDYWEAWELEPDGHPPAARWLDWWVVGDPAYPPSVGTAPFFLCGLCAEDPEALIYTDEARRRAALLSNGVRISDRTVHFQFITDSLHRLAQVTQPEELLTGHDATARADSLGDWIIAGFRALTCPIDELSPA